MNTERKKEIEKEAQRRLDLWLSHSDFDSMTCMGSFVRFDMCIGLPYGYPFIKEKWMKEVDFESFVTEEEFYSKEYDEILEVLFDSAQN
jgi:hypothetical protein